MSPLIKYFKLNRRGESQAHVVYAVTFTIIAVVALVGLIMVNTQADDSGQTASVSNAAPSAGTPITFQSSNASSDQATFTHAEGTRVNAYVTGTATDTNGCVDIDATSQYNLRVFRTTATNGFNCSANQQNCILPDSSTNLTLGSCSGTTTTITYQFNFPLGYIADATDESAPTHSATNWSSIVTVTDDSSASASATDTFEVATTRSLNVTSDTDFGTLGIGDTSASKLVTVTNMGNTITDYTVGFNQNMQCTVNSIPGRYVQLTQYPAVAYDNASSPGMAVAASPVTVNATIPVATTMASSSTDPLYLRLQIPASSGVRGACSNTAAYTAVVDDTTGY